MSDQASFGLIAGGIVPITLTIFDEASMIIPTSAEISQVSPGHEPASTPGANLSDRISSIRRTLIESYAPASSEEWLLIDRLAMARAEGEVARKAWDDRLRWQHENAVELFERTQHDQFAADSKAWREDPFGMNRVFGSTWHSAAWLADFWEGVRDRLEQGPGISFRQAKLIVTACAGDWRIDRIDTQRGHIMSLFLATTADPQAAVERWIEESHGHKNHGGDRNSLFDDKSSKAREMEFRGRAQWFLAHLPSRQRAIDDLKTIAVQESAAWKSERDRLRPHYLRERAQCAEMQSSQVIGSQHDIRETQRLRRELERARSLETRIERRLNVLLEARNRRDRNAIPKPKSQRQSLQTSKGPVIDLARAESITEKTTSEHVPPDRDKPVATGAEFERSRGEEKQTTTKRRPSPQAVAKVWNGRKRVEANSKLKRAADHRRNTPDSRLTAARSVPGEIDQVHAPPDLS
jgi:hypothetical protein